MKLLLIMILLIESLFSLSAHAKEFNFKQYLNLPYSQVRVRIMDEGWQTIVNKEINDTSLYAQIIYEKGYQEVIDCISMERDQCQFVLMKNKQYLVVSTKEQSLNIESI